MRRILAERGVVTKAEELRGAYEEQAVRALRKRRLARELMDEQRRRGEPVTDLSDAVWSTAQGDI